MLSRHAPPSYATAEEWLSIVQHSRDNCAPDDLRRLCGQAIYELAADGQSEAYAHLLIEYARSLYRLKEIDEADAQFKLACETSKKFAIVHVAAAQFELDRGNFDGCRRVLQNAKFAGAEPRSMIASALAALERGSMILGSAPAVRRTSSSMGSLTVSQRTLRDMTNSLAAPTVTRAPLKDLAVVPQRKLIAGIEPSTLKGGTEAACIAAVSHEVSPCLAATLSLSAKAPGEPPSGHQAQHLCYQHKASPQSAAADASCMPSLISMLSVSSLEPSPSTAVPVSLGSRSSAVACSAVEADRQHTYAPPALAAAPARSDLAGSLLTACGASDNNVAAHRDYSPVGCVIDDQHLARSSNCQDIVNKAPLGYRGDGTRSAQGQSRCIAPAARPQVEHPSYTAHQPSQQPCSTAVHEHSRHSTMLAGLEQLWGTNNEFQAARDRESASAAALGQAASQPLAHSRAQRLSTHDVVNVEPVSGSGGGGGDAVTPRYNIRGSLSSQHVHVPARYSSSLGQLQARCSSAAEHLPVTCSSSTEQGSVKGVPSVQHAAQTQGSLAAEHSAVPASCLASTERAVFGCSAQASLARTALPRRVPACMAQEVGLSSEDDDDDDDDSAERLGGADEGRRGATSCELGNPLSVLEKIVIKDKSYYVLNSLGRGGSSQVRRVYEPSEKSLYAVKTVNLNCGPSEQALEFFAKEIRILERLQTYRHCIVQMIDYDYNRQTNELHIVLECGDVDLATLLKNRLSDDQSSAGVSGAVTTSSAFVKSLWVDMLQAVAVLHKEGIVHSDLKPANFLLVAGRVKLIDFGIANELEEDVSSIALEHAAGTLNFMAPEVLNPQLSAGGGSMRDDDDAEASHPEANGGKPRNKCKISVRTDIWSLGCILYYATFGRTPFQHITNTAQKVAAIVSPSFDIGYPHIGDAHLLDTMKRCLVRNPRKRATIAELLLHPYVAGTASS